MLGSVINFDVSRFIQSSVARPLKLRESPKASPTILISKGVLETEGNVLPRVTAVRMIEREMGNPQPSPSVPGLFRAAGVNVLPTLACSVINLLLCAR